MRLLLNSLLGMLLGASGYTFYYARGDSYLSNDPQACVNCHVMRGEFESWEKAGHHAFAMCGDCHMPHNFINKWLTKAQPQRRPVYGMTSYRRAASCNGALNGVWTSSAPKTPWVFMRLRKQAGYSEKPSTSPGRARSRR